jgi:NitT/TauT family transport system ATP-binding protein
MNATAGLLSVRNVCKSHFDPNTGSQAEALRAVSITVDHHEFVSVIGPSGCGKSTLLRIVAGLDQPNSGEISVAGQRVSRPGADRGMVFQEYALFPWMTVAENISFGLEIKKLPKAQIREKVGSLLEMLNLQDFRDRYPKDLSGGMRQRVAIARVLALDSPIMLMDEPFGALDSLTRRNLQDELLRIWTEFKKTIIFVTHSIEESIYLADRIVVMTYRPGTIKEVVNVTMPRTRDPSSAEFNNLKKELSLLVMEEQSRHNQAETKASTAD